mmetsp:Transcript_13029/g.31852  ORF Transcript_13029/g.31852 Transcript_13029/m.31852 type:complete len:311 (-) Transcript_13029:1419-2351(-)
MLILAVTASSTACLWGIFDAIFMMQELWCPVASSHSESYTSSPIILIASGVAVWEKRLFSISPTSPVWHTSGKGYSVFANTRFVCFLATQKMSYLFSHTTKEIRPSLLLRIDRICPWFCSSSATRGCLREMPQMVTVSPMLYIGPCRRSCLWSCGVATPFPLSSTGGVSPSWSSKELRAADTKEGSLSAAPILKEGALVPLAWGCLVLHATVSAAPVLEEGSTPRRATSRRLCCKLQLNSSKSTGATHSSTALGKRSFMSALFRNSSVGNSYVMNGSRCFLVQLGKLLFWRPVRASMLCRRILSTGSSCT